MTLEIVEEIVEFGSPSGILEGVLAYPCESAPCAVTLLLSPHPQLGGDMENNVVRHLSRGCAALGHATLRFNYHGVGASSMADGLGGSAREHWAELEKTRAYERVLPDIGAAWQTLRECVGGTLPEALIGYSLGAVLAGLSAGLCPDATVVAVAPPVSRVAMTGFDGFRGEKVFVSGGADFAFDSVNFDKLYEPLAEPKTHIPFPDKDHFFRGAEEEVLRAIAPFLNSNVEGDTAR